jgi:hypothetical protein
MGPGAVSLQRTMLKEGFMPIPDCVEPSNLSGEVLEGLPFNDASILSALGSRTLKPYCAVYSWILLDVEEGKRSPEIEFRATPQDVH